MDDPIQEYFISEIVRDNEETPLLVRTALKNALQAVEYKPGDYSIIPNKYAQFHGEIQNILYNLEQRMK